MIERLKDKKVLIPLASFLAVSFLTKNLIAGVMSAVVAYTMLKYGKI